MVANFIDPELSLIGALLLRPEHISEAAAIVQAKHFNDPRCRDTFSTAVEVGGSNTDSDYLLICNAAMQRNPGITAAWVKEVMDLCPTPSNFRYYADLVVDAFKRRELSSLGERLLAAEKDTATLLAESVKLTEDLRTTGRAAHLYSPTESVRVFMDTLGAIEDGQAFFVPSGFPALDELLGGGLRRGGLYILGARTSVGKTSLALAIADRLQVPTLFASLEMTVTEISGRRIARESGIPSHEIWLPGKTEDVTNRIAAASVKLAQSRLSISDAASLTATDLSAIARRIPSIGAIVVDYLGIMESTTRHGTSREKIEEITRDLKKIAMTLDIPVLALCQLSRGVATREDKTPTLTDLRESGSIEQDADCVMLLHQIGEEPDSRTGAIKVDLIVAKNRNGAKGTIPMRTLPKCFAWREDYSRISGRGGQ